MSVTTPSRRATPIFTTRAICTRRAGRGRHASSASKARTWTESAGCATSRWLNGSAAPSRGADRRAGLGVACQPCLRLGGVPRAAKETVAGGVARLLILDPAIERPALIGPLRGAVVALHHGIV